MAQVGQDWLVGDARTKVPLSVRCAAFPNDGVRDTDAVRTGRGGMILFLFMLL
jgi:hypothetical protein